MKAMFRLMVLALAVSLVSGCAMFRASTQTVDLSDKDKHMDADFDATDLRGITESVANEISGSPFLGGQAATPIMMIAGVQNRTSQYT
ncbi:MAG: hypothetical protein JXB04_04165, partial [Kiritimatiellae bacterium]|nr:hypothetical protein [Kiritimatiellia bacterium]